MEPYGEPAAFAGAYCPVLAHDASALAGEERRAHHRSIYRSGAAGRASGFGPTRERDMTHSYGPPSRERVTLTTCTSCCGNSCSVVTGLLHGTCVTLVAKRIGRYLFLGSSGLVALV